MEKSALWNLHSPKILANIFAKSLLASLPKILLDQQRCFPIVQFSFVTLGYVDEAKIWQHLPVFIKTQKTRQMNVGKFSQNLLLGTDLA